MVKEALKDVSIQHNQAMKEQHDKFQKELEHLRKQLQERTTVTPDKPLPTVTSEKNDNTANEDTIAIDDESVTEVTQTQAPSTPQPSPTCSPIKSPAHKRPKRGRGGRSSSTNKLNE